MGDYDRNLVGLLYITCDAEGCDQEDDLVYVAGHGIYCIKCLNTLLGELTNGC